MASWQELESYILSVSEEVFNYLKSRGATESEAEDVIQITFYKLLVGLADLKADYLRAWFYRVALNEFIDLKRKEQRQQKIKESYLFVDENLLVSSEDELLDRPDLIMALDNIKNNYREILILKYYYELSYEEIATLLETNQMNVKKRLARARKAIKKQLMEDDSKWI